MRIIMAFKLELTCKDNIKMIVMRHDLMVYLLV